MRKTESGPLVPAYPRGVVKTEAEQAQQMAEMGAKTEPNPAEGGRKRCRSA